MHEAVEVSYLRSIYNLHELFKKKFVKFCNTNDDRNH